MALFGLFGKKKKEEVKKTPQVDISQGVRTPEQQEFIEKAVTSGAAIVQSSTSTKPRPTTGPTIVSRPLGPVAAPSQDEVIKAIQQGEDYVPTQARQDQRPAPSPLLASREDTPAIFTPTGEQEAFASDPRMSPLSNKGLLAQAQSQQAKEQVKRTAVDKVVEQRLKEDIKQAAMQAQGPIDIDAPQSIIEDQMQDVKQKEQEMQHEANVEVKKQAEAMIDVVGESTNNNTELASSLEDAVRGGVIKATAGKFIGDFKDDMREGVQELVGGAATAVERLTRAKDLSDDEIVEEFRRFSEKGGTASSVGKLFNQRKGIYETMFAMGMSEKTDAKDISDRFRFIAQGISDDYQREREQEKFQTQETISGLKDKYGRVLGTVGGFFVAAESNIEELGEGLAMSKFNYDAAGSGRFREVLSQTALDAGELTTDVLSVSGLVGLGRGVAGAVAKSQTAKQALKQAVAQGAKQGLSPKQVLGQSFLKIIGAMGAGTIPQVAGGILQKQGTYAVTGTDYTTLKSGLGIESNELNEDLQNLMLDGMYDAYNNVDETVLYEEQVKDILTTATKLGIDVQQYGDITTKEGQKETARAVAKDIVSGYEYSSDTGVVNVLLDTARDYAPSIQLGFMIPGTAGQRQQQAPTDEELAADAKAAAESQGAGDAKVQRSEDNSLQVILDMDPSTNLTERGIDVKGYVTEVKDAIDASHGMLSSREVLKMRNVAQDLDMVLKRIEKNGYATAGDIHFVHKLTAGEEVVYDRQMRKFDEIKDKYMVFGTPLDNQKISNNIKEVTTHFNGQYQLLDRITNNAIVELEEGRITQEQYDEMIKTRDTAINFVELMNDAQITLTYMQSGEDKEIPLSKAIVATLQNRGIEGFDVKNWETQSAGAIKYIQEQYGVNGKNPIKELDRMGSESMDVVQRVLKSHAAANKIDERLINPLELASGADSAEAILNQAFASSLARGASRAEKAVNYSKDYLADDMTLFASQLLTRKALSKVTSFSKYAKGTKLQGVADFIRGETQLQQTKAYKVARAIKDGLTDELIEGSFESIASQDPVGLEDFITSAALEASAGVSSVYASRDNYVKNKKFTKAEALNLLYGEGVTIDEIVAEQATISVKQEIAALSQTNLTTKDAAKLKELQSIDKQISEGKSLNDIVTNNRGEGVKFLKDNMRKQTNLIDTVTSSMVGTRQLASNKNLYDIHAEMDLMMSMDAMLDVMIQRGSERQVAGAKVAKAGLRQVLTKANNYIKDKKVKDVNIQDFMAATYGKVQIGKEGFVRNVMANTYVKDGKIYIKNYQNIYDKYGFTLQTGAKDPGTGKVSKVSSSQKKVAQNVEYGDGRYYYDKDGVTTNVNFSEIYYSDAPFLRDRDNVTREIAEKEGKIATFDGPLKAAVQEEVDLLKKRLQAIDDGYTQETGAESREAQGPFSVEKIQERFDPKLGDTPLTTEKLGKSSDRPFSIEKTDGDAVAPDEILAQDFFAANDLETAALAPIQKALDDPRIGEEGVNYLVETYKEESPQIAQQLIALMNRSNEEAINPMIWTDDGALNVVIAADVLQPDYSRNSEVIKLIKDITDTGAAVPLSTMAQAANVTGNLDKSELLLKIKQISLLSEIARGMNSEARTSILIRGRGDLLKYDDAIMNRILPPAKSKKSEHTPQKLTLKKKDKAEIKEAIKEMDKATEEIITDDQVQQQVQNISAIIGPIKESIKDEVRGDLNDRSLFEAFDEQMYSISDEGRTLAEKRRIAESLELQMKERQGSLWDAQKVQMARNKALGEYVNAKYNGGGRARNLTNRSTSQDAFGGMLGSHRVEIKRLLFKDRDTFAGKTYEEFVTGREDYVARKKTVVALDRVFDIVEADLDSREITDAIGQIEILKDSLTSNDQNHLEELAEGVMQKIGITQDIINNRSSLNGKYLRRMANYIKDLSPLAFANTPTPVGAGTIFNDTERAAEAYKRKIFSMNHSKPRKPNDSASREVWNEYKKKEEIYNKKKSQQTQFKQDRLDFITNEYIIETYVNGRNVDAEYMALISETAIYEHAQTVSRSAGSTISNIVASKFVHARSTLRRTAEGQILTLDSRQQRATVGDVILMQGPQSGQKTAVGNRLQKEGKAVYFDGEVFGKTTNGSYKFDKAGFKKGLAKSHKEAIDKGLPLIVDLGHITPGQIAMTMRDVESLSTWSKKGKSFLLPIIGKDTTEYGKKQAAMQVKAESSNSMPTLDPNLNPSSLKYGLLIRNLNAYAGSDRFRLGENKSKSIEEREGFIVIDRSRIEGPPMRDANLVDGLYKELFPKTFQDISLGGELSDEDMAAIRAFETNTTAKGKGKTKRLTTREAIQQGKRTGTTRGKANWMVKGQLVQFEGKGKIYEVTQVRKASDVSMQEWIKNEHVRNEEGYKKRATSNNVHVNFIEYTGSSDGKNVKRVPMSYDPKSQALYKYGRDTSSKSLKLEESTVARVMKKINEGQVITDPNSPNYSVTEKIIDLAYMDAQVILADHSYEGFLSTDNWYTDKGIIRDLVEKKYKGLSKKEKMTKLTTFLVNSYLENSNAEIAEYNRAVPHEDKARSITHVVGYDALGVPTTRDEGSIMDGAIYTKERVESYKQAIKDNKQSLRADTLSQVITGLAIKSLYKSHNMRLGRANDIIAKAQKDLQRVRGEMLEIFTDYVEGDFEANDKVSEQYAPVFTAVNRFHQIDISFYAKLEELLGSNEVINMASDLGSIIDQGVAGVESGLRGGDLDIAAKKLIEEYKGKYGKDMQIYRESSTPFSIEEFNDSIDDGTDQYEITTVLGEEIKKRGKTRRKKIQIPVIADKVLRKALLINSGKRQGAKIKTSETKGLKDIYESVSSNEQETLNEIAVNIGLGYNFVSVNLSETGSKKKNEQQRAIDDAVKVLSKGEAVDQIISGMVRSLQALGYSPKWKGLDGIATKEILTQAETRQRIKEIYRQKIRNDKGFIRSLLVGPTPESLASRMITFLQHVGYDIGGVVQANAKISARPKIIETLSAFSGPMGPDSIDAISVVMELASGRNRSLRERFTSQGIGTPTGEDLDNFLSTAKVKIVRSGYAYEYSIDDALSTLTRNINDPQGLREYIENKYSTFTTPDAERAVSGPGEIRTQEVDTDRYTGQQSQSDKLFLVQMFADVMDEYKGVTGLQHPSRLQIDGPAYFNIGLLIDGGVGRDVTTEVELSGSADLISRVLKVQDMLVNSGLQNNNRALRRYIYNLVTSQGVSVTPLIREEIAKATKQILPNWRLKKEQQDAAKKKGFETLWNIIHTSRAEGDKIKEKVDGYISNPFIVAENGVSLEKQLPAKDKSLLKLFGIDIDNIQVDANYASASDNYEMLTDIYIDTLSKMDSVSGVILGEKLKDNIKGYLNSATDGNGETMIKGLFGGFLGISDKNAESFLTDLDQSQQGHMEFLSKAFAWADKSMRGGSAQFTVQDSVAVDVNFFDMRASEQRSAVVKAMRRHFASKFKDKKKVDESVKKLIDSWDEAAEKIDPNSLSGIHKVYNNTLMKLNAIEKTLKQRITAIESGRKRSEDVELSAQNAEAVRTHKETIRKIQEWKLSQLVSIGDQKVQNRGLAFGILETDAMTTDQMETMIEVKDLYEKIVQAEIDGIDWKGEERLDDEEAQAIKEKIQQGIKKLKDELHINQEIQAKLERQTDGSLGVSMEQYGTSSGYRSAEKDVTDFMSETIGALYMRSVSNVSTLDIGFGEKLIMDKANAIWGEQLNDYMSQLSDRRTLLYKRMEEEKSLEYVNAEEKDIVIASLKSAIEVEKSKVNDVKYIKKMIKDADFVDLIDIQEKFFSGPEMWRSNETNALIAKEALAGSIMNEYLKESGKSGIVAVDKEAGVKKGKPVKQRQMILGSGISTEEYVANRIYELPAKEVKSFFTPRGQFILKNNPIEFRERIQESIKENVEERTQLRRNARRMGKKATQMLQEANRMYATLFGGEEFRDDFKVKMLDAKILSLKRSAQIIELESREIGDMAEFDRVQEEIEDLTFERKTENEKPVPADGTMKGTDAYAEIQGAYDQAAKMEQQRAARTARADMIQTKVNALREIGKTGTIDLLDIVNDRIESKDTLLQEKSDRIKSTLEAQLELHYPGFMVDYQSLTNKIIEGVNGARERSNYTDAQKALKRDISEPLGFGGYSETDIKNHIAQAELIDNARMRQSSTKELEQMKKLFTSYKDC